jgi:tetratricopeptide (TPR) repeat protein
VIEVGGTDEAAAGEVLAAGERRRRQQGTSAARSPPREAIRLDPRNAKAHRNLGYILHLKRNEPGAIAAYRESIRIDRYFALAHADLGDALRAIGDWDGAIAAFREAVRLTPNSVRDHLKLASALYHQGYVVETLEEYREVIRLDPKHVEAHSQLAWLRATYPDAKFRDGKEAVKLATKATVLLSKNWDHLDTLAAAFAEAGASRGPWAPSKKRSTGSRPSGGPTRDCSTISTDASSCFRTESHTGSPLPLHPLRPRAPPAGKRLG